MLSLIELPGDWRESQGGFGCAEGRYGIVDPPKVLVPDPAIACIGLQKRELPMHAATPFWMESIVLHVIDSDDAYDILDSNGHPELYSLEQR